MDTPDGGRSHRRTLIDALGKRWPVATTEATASPVVFLQPNRDLEEAGLDLRDRYTWDGGFPDIDALFLEWRWPIGGRNTTPCGSTGHTCDLHRQAALVKHYTQGLGTPTLLWDKDLQLPTADPLRRHPAVTVCEAALHPSPSARSLLFPVADNALDRADPGELTARPRPLPLVYIGNQYDRDELFDQFFAGAAYHVEHRVAGKWTRTESWPHVAFTGRCSYPDVERLYRTSLATVLLLPDRYSRVGQMTQRVFESVLAGCLPLTPAIFRSASTFTPPELHVHGAGDVVRTVRWLHDHQGSREHMDLVAACVRRLDVFRVSRQILTIASILDENAASPSDGVSAGRPLETT